MTIDFCKEWHDAGIWYLTRVNNSAMPNSWSRNEEEGKEKYQEIVEAYKNKPQEDKIVLEFTIL